MNIFSYIRIYCNILLQNKKKFKYLMLIKIVKKKEIFKINFPSNKKFLSNRAHDRKFLSSKIM